MSILQAFEAISADYCFTPRPEGEPASLWEDIEDPDLITVDEHGTTFMCAGLVRTQFPSYHLMDPKAFEPLQAKLKRLFERAQQLNDDYEEFIDEFHAVLAEQCRLRRERYPEVMTALKETLAGDEKARERLT